MTALQGLNMEEGEEAEEDTGEIEEEDSEVEIFAIIVEVMTTCPMIVRRKCLIILVIFAIKKDIKVLNALIKQSQE